MILSSYIWDCLKRYGKADLGPLGIFELDYTPAKWQIPYQSFNPPFSKVKWTPVDESTDHNYSALAQVIAAKHDIGFGEAYDFVAKTINNSATEDVSEISLGTLGLLKKDSNQSRFSSFVLNTDVEKKLRIKPLDLYKLRGDTDSRFNWWWLLLSFLLLSALFIIIGAIVNRYNYSFAEHKYKNNVPKLETSAVKQTNISPNIVTERNSSADTIITLPKIIGPTEIIVITGSYCSKKNIERAKKIISAAGYTVYEEKISSKCTRIGLQLTSSENPDLLLQKIRNTLEPTAWILDKNL